MTRILEYRIWDSINKKFIIDDNSFTLLQNGKIMERYKKVNLYSINCNYEPSLFTGLLDKNGNKIFEGDIVRVLYSDRPSKKEDDKRTLDEYMNHLSHKGEVVRAVDRFVIDIGSHHSILPGNHGFVEVIGNIYEKKYKYEVNTSKGLMVYEGRFG